VPSLTWPDGLGEALRAAGRQLHAWLLMDVAAGRLVPWLAVAFGFGIVVYFSASREPLWWAALVPLGAASLGVFFARRHALGFPLVLAAAAAAAGFATVSVKRALIDHPVLQAPAWNVEISGFVEVREARERSDRITLRVDRITGATAAEDIERVRLSVRKGTAPAVGSFVESRARLTPPLEPLRPGGYDFGRDLYFQRIGASGFALGSIKTVEPPSPASLSVRYAALMDGMRTTIDQRIRAVLSGDNASIASALITGTRDAISTPVNDAMYVSGIGHVLSISGYHMAVVAGAVFFFLRAILALLPAAGRYPIKKWAALAALGAATFYLLLSGAEVATQRSYIMIAIVLVGVMVDRPALTLRTLTVAALGVLLLAPEAVVHPSFQMSFAATLALVAGYERGLSLSWTRAGRDSALGARLALWGVREIVGLVFASLLAGTATMPFAAYHFHRLAPYGALANLLAMPVVSAWVMPMGILGVLAVPFGFDDICWRLMGDGLDWMVAVALWVNSLPGAVGRMAAFGTGPLLLCTAGLLLLCLLRSPLRLIGLALITGAILWALHSPRPDVLIAPDGTSLAVRSGGGRLAIARTGGDTFATREWLAADADARAPKDASLGQGLACDKIGCVGRLADGALVAFPRAIAAFEEDCRRAALVVSAHTAPPDCAATVIDHAALQRYGAVALRRVGRGFELTASRPDGYDRPWAQAVRPQGTRSGDVPESSVMPRAPARDAARRDAMPKDAMPKPEDLEPGD
jgi:competence protein ComEC